MKKAKNKKYFIVRHRYIIALFLLLFDLLFLPRIPYVNLLYNYLNILLLFPAAVLIVRFNGSRLLITGTVLFIVMLLLTLIGENSLAELAGNITYFILLFGIILLIRDAIKMK